MTLTKQPLNFVRVFGALLVVLVARYFVHGWIDAQFHAPRMLFPWIEGLRPWPRPWMHVHFAALGVLALAMAAGVRARPAAGLFCAGFTYVQLLDRTTYLNHYYLISLVTGLVAAVPPARLGAALRFQATVVYVFAGVAKLQSDWLLRAQPMRIWLADVPLLCEPWVAYAASWAAAAYDLAIPFLLMARRTRPWAFATAVVFHVATALLFPIGLFPWVMLACLLVFFERPESCQAAFSRRWAVAFGAYAAVQVVVPLLALREPHDVRFAWRVMVAEKSATMRVRVDGREIAPPLTPLQARVVPSTPDLLRSFLRRLHEETGRPVEADVAVSINGRPSSPIRAVAGRLSGRRAYNPAMPHLTEAGTSVAAALEKKIRAKKARVAVIGLGYVGLPLVRLFAAKGFNVLGFDVDPAKIEKLRKGESYIKSVNVAKLRSRFEATADFSRLPEADAIIICVPTPLHEDSRPDVSYIQSTARTIGRHLREGQLVILESTTYPGSTRELLKPELDKAGVEYFLAFSPEREDPGNKKFTNADIPKVVGGIDAPSRRLAAALYGSAVVRVVEVSSPEVAEAAKLLENIYRCVNIALVNELKMCFEKMGIDVWEVIAAASTKPFGFQPFYPGPGMGGHCIPLDPFYLSWKAKEFQFQTRFIELAGQINVQMPYYVVGRLEEALRSRRQALSGAKILVLGLAYKKDIDDPRESPAWKVIELLEQRGAEVRWHDPSFTKLPATRHYRHLKAKSTPLSEKSLAAADAAIIVTDHSAYDYPWILQHARLLIDTRNACPAAPTVVKA